MKTYTIVFSLMLLFAFSLTGCSGDEQIIIPAPDHVSPGDPDDPANLIYNGDFEGYGEGALGRLDYWEGRYSHITTGLKKSGEAACWTHNNSDNSFEGTDGPIPVSTPTDYDLVAQWVKVEKNTDYIAKAWVWIDRINGGEITSAPQGAIGVMLDDKADTTEIVFEQQLVFLEKSHTFNSGNNEYVKFFVKTYAGSQVWHIDDVSIRKL